MDDQLLLRKIKFKAARKKRKLILQHKRRMRKLKNFNYIQQPLPVSTPPMFNNTNIRTPLSDITYYSLNKKSQPVSSAINPFNASPSYQLSLLSKHRFDLQDSQHQFRKYTSAVNISPKAMVEAKTGESSSSTPYQFSANTLPSVHLQQHTHHSKSRLQDQTFQVNLAKKFEAVNNSPMCNPNVRPEAASSPTMCHETLQGLESPLIIDVLDGSSSSRTMPTKGKRKKPTIVIDEQQLSNSDSSSINEEDNYDSGPESYVSESDEENDDVADFEFTSIDLSASQGETHYQNLTSFVIMEFNFLISTSNSNSLFIKFNYWTLILKVILILGTHCGNAQLVELKCGIKKGVRNQEIHYNLGFNCVVVMVRYNYHS
jgi:hypothetical protein